MRLDNDICQLANVFMNHNDEDTAPLRAAIEAVDLHIVAYLKMR